MNASRSIIWMLGLVFIVGGALLLYLEAGLSRWVSIGIIVAGLLVFIGLAVMGFASGAPNDARTTVVREDRGVTVDSRPTVVEGNDRRGR